MQEGNIMKRTKIVCTIGPACSSVAAMTEMLKNGMNVARFNMSHGDFAGHEQLVNNARKASNSLGLPLAIMIDTKGPEIRIGKFENGYAELAKNQQFVLTTNQVVGDNFGVSVSYADLPKVVKKGMNIYLDDGKITLVVENTSATEIFTKVLVGGKLADGKAINVPDADIKMPYVSKYDEQTVEFACKVHADFLSISFVGCKDDVLQIRKLLQKYGGENIKIISKIESKKGTHAVKEILQVSDGVMVARGDLGVEVDFSKIPVLQKQIVRECIEQGKISIIATQMLESMTTGTRPTRAEISDVANAVLENASAVMLSSETSVGINPALAVKTMTKIIEEVEQYNGLNLFDYTISNKLRVTDGIAYGANALATSVGAKAICCIYDKVADNISDFRPNMPIYFFTKNQEDYNQSCLLSGVVSFFTDTKLTEKGCLEYLENNKFVKNGDYVVVVNGNRISLEQIS